MNAQNAEKHLWVIKKDIFVDCASYLWKERLEEVFYCSFGYEHLFYKPYFGFYIGRFNVSKGLWITEESLVDLKNDITTMFYDGRAVDYESVNKYLEGAIASVTEAPVSPYNPKDNIDELLEMYRRQEGHREENLVESIAIAMINGHCVNNPVNHLNMNNIWDIARKVSKAKGVEQK